MGGAVSVEKSILFAQERVLIQKFRGYFYHVGLKNKPTPPFHNAFMIEDVMSVEDVTVSEQL